MHTLATRIFKRYSQVLNDYISSNYADKFILRMFIPSDDWELAKKKKISAISFKQKIDQLLENDFRIGIADILSNVRHIEEKEILQVNRARKKHHHDAGRYDAILFAMHSGLVALSDIFDAEFYELRWEDALHVLVAEYLVVLAYDRSLAAYDGLDHRFDGIGSFDIDGQEVVHKQTIAPVDASMKRAFRLGSGFSVDQKECFDSLEKILSSLLENDVELSKQELCAKLILLKETFAKVSSVSTYFTEEFSITITNYSEPIADSSKIDAKSDNSNENSEKYKTSSDGSVRNSSRYLHSQATTPSIGFLNKFSASTPSTLSLYSIADLERPTFHLFDSGSSTPKTIMP